MGAWTIGHGRRPIEELLECLLAAGVGTLVDVRRYPRSRRNPQFDQSRLVEALAAVGISYRHAVELGGRLHDEPGADRFPCIREPAFASYAARMGADSWQEALALELSQPSPCFLCAETLWWTCHRRLIADILVAWGHEVFHLIRPGVTEAHSLSEGAVVSEGRLHLCGALVA